MQDILTQALSHSWGTKPEQKRREKEYNHEYYLKNKEKWQDNRPLARTKNVSKRGYGVRLRGMTKDDYNEYIRLRKERDAYYDSNILLSDDVPLSTIEYNREKRRKKMQSIYELNKNAQKQISKGMADTAKSQSGKNLLNAAKKQYYLNELAKDQAAAEAKKNRSSAKKARDFIDGTVEVAMDRIKNKTASGKKFLSDFFGLGS